jgi:predicted AlkP superfamily phosphohydrolase/phosphomutase
LTTWKRVAVLGLDGVPFSLLERFFAQGITPNLASLACGGVFAPISTDHPAVSSVSWTSFMTGVGPGRHGIFGFTDLKAGERTLRLPSFDDIAAPVLWRSQKAPLRALVVNLPFTYPARPLNGTLIAGFVAPVFERAVYPSTLIPWLMNQGYRTDVDAERGRRDRGALVQDLFETLKVHGNVMTSLIRSQPWDLFTGVITGTDRLHHFLFDAAEDESHPFHDDFLRYYREVDLVVGRVWESLPPDTLGVLLSDHGFTRSRGQIYLNTILERMGRLSYTRPQPRSLRDVDPRSVAFALDPNRIYLNGKRRFPDGALSPGREGEVRAALKRDLESLTTEAVGVPQRGPEKPFMEALTAEEAYEGPLSAMGPDLIAIPAPGLDVRGSFGSPVAWNMDIFTGTHTHDDAFLIIDHAPHAVRHVPKSVSEVGRLVMSALDTGSCRADLP